MSDDLVKRLDKLVEDLGEGRACYGHEYIDAAVDAIERIEALEAQVRAADALAEAGERYRAAVAGMLVQLERTGALDSIVSDLFPESKKRGVRADQGFAAVDAARNNVKQWSDVYDASAAAYRATKEGGA